MYAVIVTGGKQYRVQAGDTLRVEKLPSDVGMTIDFDKVLLVGEGDAITVGTPYVEGGKVSATVKSHGRSKKIKVLKFKRRKNYRRHLGHRQSYTELEITSVAAHSDTRVAAEDESATTAEGTETTAISADITAHEIQRVSED